MGSWVAQSAEANGRRARQFSLRNMFAVVTLLCAVFSLCAWHVHKVQQQSQIARALEKKGVLVVWKIYPTALHAETGTGPPATISDDDAPLIGRLIHLEALSLFVYKGGRRNNRITDKTLRHIAHLKRVETLALMSTCITDEGLKHVGTMESLTYLDISCTAITDDGLKHLETLHRLRTLLLLKTNVTEQGVASLSDALPNCDITWR